MMSSRCQWNVSVCISICSYDSKVVNCIQKFTINPIFIFYFVRLVGSVPPRRIDQDVAPQKITQRRGTIAVQATTGTYTPGKRTQQRPQSV